MIESEFCYLEDNKYTSDLLVYNCFNRTDTSILPVFSADS